MEIENWASGAAGVASIDANTGVITGVAQGNATVTADVYYTNDLGATFHKTVSVVVTVPAP